jgi:hypothetical protein
MDVDGAEIKVNVAEDDIDRAIQVLELDHESAVRIWFYEDTTPGVGVPLLDAGMVVRVRAFDDDKPDSTAKLRPCRRSQLTDHWIDVASVEKSPLKVEQDWSAKGRVLAASLKAELEASAVASVEDSDGAGVPEGVLTDDQARFLDECGPVRVNPAELTRLGPIAAIKWGDADADALGDLEIRAERWTVGGLDFLEVSIKVDDLAEAEKKQRALDAALKDLGVRPDTNDDSKTRRVLMALSGLSLS